MDTPSTPFMVRFAEKAARVTGSTSMQNPDTSTYNTNTEDSDT